MAGAARRFGLAWMLLCLWQPAPALAHSDAYRKAQRALHEAQERAEQHRAESEAARRSAQAAAARAAALAQQQVAAAARLRQLEDQTATAAATLDSLAAQAEAAQLALQADAAALTRLLPVMERLSREPAASLLAVPATPADAIRGVLVLQGIAAEIEARAKAMRQQAAQVAALQQQTRAQQAALGTAVKTQQQAEDALSRQIASARSTETADLDTAVQAAAAATAASANARSLQNVIERLQAAEQAQLATSRLPPPQPQGSAALSNAPVAGVLAQDWGAPTVAGPAVGMTYRAAPGARVVAPCSGPVLYADRFRNYGLLVILDCGRSYDFVLSGMQQLDVTAGQRVSSGQPLGQMSGYDPAAPTRQPMLYMELRQNGKPVNPALWLKRGGSG